MQSISLSALAQTIKDALASQLALSYWVTAEIGEMKVNAKGHCYLELIEKDGSQVKAKMRAAIWAYDFRNINQWFEKITGGPLREGINILSSIQVSFHEVYGLNLTIKDVDPNFTLGERERIRQETISRLHDEGLMELNKKLPLPLVPQRIAVISSSSAAGYGDFIHQLQTNPKGFKVSVTLFNAVLQGNESATSVAEALKAISEVYEQFDAIVIIRGGGAQMDLDAFNDYALCSRIASSPLPVFTGIGHERDETIADMVAHTRLKTPTAVAEFILGGFQSYGDAIQLLASRLLQTVQSTVEQQRHMFGQLQKDIRYLALQKVKNDRQQVKELKLVLANATRWNLERKRTLLKELHQKLRTSVLSTTDGQKHELVALETRINASNPDAILARGYTITKAGGKLLKDAKLKKGMSLTTYFQKGTLESEVSAINNHE